MKPIRSNHKGIGALFSTEKLCQLLKNYNVLKILIIELERDTCLLHQWTQTYKIPREILLSKYPMNI